MLYAPKSKHTANPKVFLLNPLHTQDTKMLKDKKRARNATTVTNAMLVSFQDRPKL